MLLINIQSTKSKLDALLYHMMPNDIFMWFITKTWINTDHNLQLIEADITGLGYVILNKHKDNQSGEGVVCIYKMYWDIQTCTEEDTLTSFESQTIKLKVKSKLHWISTIYRLLYAKKYPIPTTTFIDEFLDHLLHILCQTDNPIIIGDINIPWKTGNSDTTSWMRY